MSTNNFLFTSESVTEGHPDKLADQISDGILDSILSQDPQGRVACETLVKTGMAVLAGEVSTNCWVDTQEVVRSIIKEVGYTDANMGFDYKTCAVLSAIEKQSPDISQGVNTGEGLFKEQGAGDQGMMFGYACNENDAFMPTPILLAHNVTRKLAAVRKNNKLDFLRPDGKSQVSVRYENMKPVKVEAVVVSTQHTEEASYDSIKEGVIEEVIKKEIPANFWDDDIKIYVNPTGRFVIGGPQGDAGLTGRKIIVDTYGGWGRHGGGAFSGKDPSKVDRSAAYMMRYVAKNIVAAGLADRCEVQVAYAIGVADPVSILVNTFGTGKIAENKIADLVAEKFGLKPREIIETLDLLKPIYTKTAAYGHFGRTDQDFTWERTDRAEELKKAAL